MSMYESISTILGIGLLFLVVFSDPLYRWWKERHG